MSTVQRRLMVESGKDLYSRLIKSSIQVARWYAGRMQTMSISAAKAKLNELVDDAARTHEHLTITKNGAPAAVMVSADEWESIQETLFWQSQPHIADDLAQAREDLESGDTLTGDKLRARYGLPPLAQ